VLEPSNNFSDPPRVKLEPADGVHSASLLPAADDLASPENAAMLRPMVLRSYLGGAVVFQIDDVRRTADGALELDVTIAPPAPDVDNLLANPGVEDGVHGWTTGGWMPEQAQFGWADLGANGSAHSLFITAPSENDVEWKTRVEGLTPGGRYLLCGDLRGEGVVAGRGATLSLSGTFTATEGVHGTFDWTRRCAQIYVAVPVVDVACRLGGFGATTAGTMWCDNVRLVPILDAFPDR
jgi:hypothetical protein